MNSVDKVIITALIGLTIVFSIGIMVKGYINSPSELTFNLNTDNETKEVFESIENINNINCDYEKINVYSKYLEKGYLERIDLNLTN